MKLQAIAFAGAVAALIALSGCETMSAEECAENILDAVKKNKRTLVLTLRGKQTVLLNKLFPAWADKLTKNFFFKDGKLVK